MPLALQCGGLYQHLPNYDFVGRMDETFYQELGRFTERYPPLEAGVRKIFKLDGKENATNMGTERQAAMHTASFYTPNTIRKVLQYTSIDYMMLNLSIPQWAEDILLQDETFLL